MADTQDTHPLRTTEAQSVRENRDHQQQTQNATHNPVTRAYHRRALAELWRAKEAARCRAREGAVVRLADTSDAGQQPHARDHRGEVR